MSIICSTVIRLLLTVKTLWPISGHLPVVLTTWMKWGDLGAVLPLRKTSNHETTACSVKGTLWAGFCHGQNFKLLHFFIIFFLFFEKTANW